MEAVRIKEINKRRVYQIIEDREKSLLEKRVELRKRSSRVKYIVDYCVEKNLSIKFDCGLVLDIKSIESRGVRNEFIDIALNDFTFERNMDKTYLDQLNICRGEEYIVKTDQNMFSYRFKDLNKMINEKVSCISLFGIRDYILKCPPTACNLRKYCILEKLLPISDFYKRLRPPNYYERLLGFKVSIERGKKTYVFLHALGKGFNKDIDEESIDEESIDKEDNMDYFDFLDINVNYPETLGKLFDMNRKLNKEGLNLIEVYNKNIRECFEWVNENIFTIERFPYGHPKFNLTLHRYILKDHFPDIYKELKITGRNDDPEVIAAAVDSLGI